MKKIVIAHGHTSIEVLHSMVPFILNSKDNSNYKFDFIDYRLKNIFKISGDLLILIRKYHDGKTSNNQIIQELKKLRNNFSKIVYFDDSAAASILFFCAIPYVDEYWKRSCLNDKDLYQKEFYGGHLFSDFYHRNYGIDDGNKYFTNPIMDDSVDINKLKISWNIGIGIYPLNQNLLFDNHYNFCRRAITAMTVLPNIGPIYKIISKLYDRLIKELEREINFKSKITKISSRFGFKSYRRSIGYQRELYLNFINGNEKFLKGIKSKKEYIKETYNIKGVLSPFGWGEICYRDFEAIIAGSYLIKPKIDHINTWPNIYDNNNFYLNWDMSNLDNLENIFDNLKKIENSVNENRENYKNCLINAAKRSIDMINNLI